VTDCDHHRRCRPRAQASPRRRCGRHHQIHRGHDRERTATTRRREARQTAAQKAVRKGGAAILSALALATSLVGTLHAVRLRNVLTDYTLSSFSRKVGLAGPVWAIAQDGGGFLWLGTDEGLFRFDGVRFLNWDQIGSASLPHLTVRSLKVTHDKSLW